MENIYCLQNTRCQRRQQPSLPRRVAHSQVLPAPLELVKLQLHQTGWMYVEPVAGSISPD